MTWLKQIDKAETKQIRIPRYGMHDIREGYIHLDSQDKVDWLLSQKAEHRYKMRFKIVPDDKVPIFPPKPKIATEFNVFPQTHSIKHITIGQALHNIKIKERSFPSFSISILCLNRLEYTKKCIESILNAKTDCVYELLITDNGSTDETKKYINGLTDSRVVAIFHKKNIGFVGGHKYALEQAKNKIFLLLNNDIIVGDNWLDDIAKGFEEYNVKAVGTVSGIVNNKGDGMPYDGDDFDYLEGSCLAVPTKFIKEYGLFDPRYKDIYYEDFDLSLRLRSDGFKLKKVKADVKHSRSYLAIETIPEGKNFIKSNQSLHIEKWGNYIKTKTLDVNPFIIEDRTFRIIRDDAMGDVLYTLPIAKELKTINPKCKVIIQTKTPQLVFPNKYVDKTVNYEPDIDNNEFILNLRMAHEERRTMNIIEANQDKIGLKVKDERPEININKGLNKQYKDSNIGNYVVMHWGPPPGWDGRALGVDKINKIAHYIKNQGYKIIELGHRQNVSFADSVLLNNSWDKNIIIINNAKGFVGIDSSLMHVAQALNIPGVAVFGCVDPKSRLLKNSSIKPVYAKNLECKFCWNNAQEALRVINCTKPKQYCMDMITNEMVIVEVMKTIFKIDRIEKIDNYLFVNRNNIELNDLKIDWGCGFRKEPGYVGVDIQAYPEVDIICDVSNGKGFPNNCAIEIRSLHFIEHNTFEDIPKILNLWKRILKPKGVLRIYFPDLSLINRKINPDRALDFAFGQHLNEYDIHKSFWTPYLMCKFMKDAGFKKVKAIEYDGPLHTITNLQTKQETVCTSGVEGYK